MPNLATLLNKSSLLFLFRLFLSEANLRRFQFLLHARNIGLIDFGGYSLVPLVQGSLPWAEAKRSRPVF